MSMSLSYDPNNIFAKILRGEIPAKKIYEDEYALAFHDLYPKAPVHALIIPKGEYTDIVDFGLHADAISAKGFWQAVAKVAGELGIAENGFRLISNCRDHGGQEVPHFHVHLLGGQQMGPMVAH